MQLGSKGQIKLLHWGKDGGPNSKVWGFWLVGIKSLFSLALLRFDPGSREAYHSHAFNCVSWVLRGELHEHHMDGTVDFHCSGKRITTKRETFHKVYSVGRSWVLTLRGPWAKTWREYTSERGVVVLTHGREEVGECQCAECRARLRREGEYWERLTNLQQALKE